MGDSENLKKKLKSLSDSAQRSSQKSECFSGFVFVFSILTFKVSLTWNFLRTCEFQRPGRGMRIILNGTPGFVKTAKTHTHLGHCSAPPSGLLPPSEALVLPQDMGSQKRKTKMVVLIDNLVEHLCNVGTIPWASFVSTHLIFTQPCRVGLLSPFCA